MWILNLRLYNEFHRDWNTTSLNHVNNAFGKNFKFHSNLSIPNKTINSVPSYYLVTAKAL